MQLIPKALNASLAFLFTACAGVPEGIEPVSGLEPNRYMGTWYEIARLDHSFERNLTNVTAYYSLNADGGIDVINRGYNTEKGTWEEAEGDAHFAESEDIGHLKVSFFGPFYGSYVIFELDKENYSYSFVTGNDRGNLWLLARTPEVPQALIDRFMQEAERLGFATEKLIFVPHDRQAEN